ncbi:hypothetical protein [Roseibacillus ishigakijimensis]|uniref:PEP-CTERM protein-sorting domain-containing protein n=1 Tax=Roseibacillus ishigakijimensis TaxID=454146 RepID=A0A934RNF1_9BACT|nr:hypothetical protein [Roseibacillus ishigakijimensis]MBK1834599.1 hypothetical protein [Roseibacillus ishigakijimensis]
MKAKSILFSLAASAGFSQAALIYSDDFSGDGSASLNGLAPDTANGVDGGTAGATWSSHSSIFNNGNVNNSTDGSALLPISLVADRIYSLTVTLTPGSTTVDTDWLGFGFNQSATVGGGAGTNPATNAGRFTDNGINGKVWAIFRENSSDAGSGGDIEFFSSVTSGQIATTETGATFDGFASHTATIMLDTTGGVLNANLLVDGVSITAGYQPVSGVALGDIQGVGLTHNNTTQAGVRFESFSLSSVPEPSSAVLASMSLLALLRRRR